MTLLKNALLGLALSAAPLVLIAEEPIDPKEPAHMRNQRLHGKAPKGEALKPGQEPRKPRRPMHHMAGGDMDMVAGMELSDEQQKKLEAGADERGKKEAAAQKKLQDARAAFETLSDEARNDSGHLSKLRSAHSDLKDAERKLEDLRFEARLELRGALDQEQMKKIGERRAKRMKHVQGERPKHPGKHPEPDKH